MLKRILIVLSISVVVVLALEPVQAVHGILMTDSQVRQLDAADNSTSDLSSSQDGSGNKFVRALKAPFKAIGRLFGRGKKEENKFERLTEKDVKKFDSARVTRIEDAISVPATAAPTSIERISFLRSIKMH